MHKRNNFTYNKYCISAIMSHTINYHFRIIIWFQGWYEGTLKGLGSSVGHSRSRELEQYTGIPDWIWRHNESSIVDARRPNHDGIHSMTSVEHFCRKRIAVNPLHTPVLGVPQHQTIKQGKWPLCWADSCSSKVWRRAFTCDILCIKRIMHIMNMEYKIIIR